MKRDSESQFQVAVCHLGHDLHPGVRVFGLALSPAPRFVTVADARTFAQSLIAWRDREGDNPRVGAKHSI